MTDFFFDADRVSLSKDRLAEVQELRQKIAAKCLPFNIAFLDEIAVGIAPMDLIIIGALTGSGKTTLGAIIAEKNAMNGKRVTYFALEAFPGEIESRILYRIISKLAFDRQHPGVSKFSYAHWLYGRCSDIDRDLHEEAEKKFQAECGLLSTYYRTSKFTSDHLVQMMNAIRSETDLIILDHLHFIDNDDAEENRGMKAIVKAISDAINVTQTPVIAIAHLRKRDLRKPRLVPEIDDFHGASDITKIATKCVVLAPAREYQTGSPFAFRTFVRMGKDRFVGDKALTALLTFDVRRTGYLRDYELGRLSPDGQEWNRLPPAERPWWATNGLCLGTP
jgi:hypothetical protein